MSCNLQTKTGALVYNGDLLLFCTCVNRHLACDPVPNYSFRLTGIQRRIRGISSGGVFIASFVQINTREL